jgi:hypothetical protein
MSPRQLPQRKSAADPIAGASRPQNIGDDRLNGVLAYRNCRVRTKGARSANASPFGEVTMSQQVKVRRQPEPWA